MDGIHHQPLDRYGTAVGINQSSDRHPASSTPVEASLARSGLDVAVPVASARMQATLELVPFPSTTSLQHGKFAPPIG